MTKLNDLLGISDKRLSIMHSVAFTISLILPYLIFIGFVLLVGRLIIGANTGIFNNDYLYGAILEIVSTILLITSLTILIFKTNIPTLLAVAFSAAFSRIPDFIIGLDYDLIILNVLTYSLLIILMRRFLVRFKDFRKGLILAFVLSFVISQVVGNLMHGLHVYRYFGEAAVINSIESGEAIRKLIFNISGAVILTLLFSISLVITYRITGIRARMAQ